MTVFKLGQKGAADLKVYMRATDRWQFTNRLDPRAWAASTAFSNGEYCKPSVANGFKFRSNGGRSGGTEPSWVADVGEITQDGSIEWVAETDLFALDANETVTASVWTADAGVILGTDADTGFEPAFTAATTSVWVIGFEPTFAETSFVLTNVVTTSTGRKETVEVKVGFLL